MSKKPKTVKRKKRKPVIILPPSMEARGLQCRALAVKIEDTWEPGCVHLVGNHNAIVMALRPTDAGNAERTVARLKAFLTDLM